ncbi:MAG TPA: hypothetical protein VG871_22970 [Vicinamibacterales bacterium]|nr:hypothetical protein [Vicinamibacterales bacterium]
MSEHISATRLWFAILAPPAVWIAQGALGWFFGDRICTDMSIGSVRLVTGLISLAALGTTLVALGIARENWRQSVSSTLERTLQGRDRVEFMSVSGVFVSSLFIVAIVWAGLSSVLINVCGGMR